MTVEPKIPLLGMTLAELQQVVKEAGMPGLYRQTDGGLAVCEEGGDD